MPRPAHLPGTGCRQALTPWARASPSTCSGHPGTITEIKPFPWNRYPGPVDRGPGTARKTPILVWPIGARELHDKTPILVWPIGARELHDKTLFLVTCTDSPIERRPAK